MNCEPVKGRTKMERRRGRKEESGKENKREVVPGGKMAGQRVVSKFPWQ